MKILSVVVTFFPEEDLLRKNVSAFIDHVDKVLVWENTPKEEKFKYRFIQHKKVEYCGDGANSISHALNSAWHYAQENGYDYLLTMDQDSIWENFSEFKASVIEWNKKSYCICGPLVNKKLSSHHKFVRSEAIITSGTMMPVELLESLRGYCELFGIDGIDNGLCIKASSREVPIYQYCNARIIQRFGNPRIVKLGLWEINRYNYSPSRLYEMFRNNIILYRKYRNSHWARYTLRLYVKAYIFGVLFFDSNKKEKLISVAKGIRDGLRYDINAIKNL